MLRGGILLAQTCTAYKILVINDIHLALDIDQTIMPGPGGETNQRLLEVMLEKSTQDHSSGIDLILSPGDFIQHGLSVSTGSTPQWSTMLDTFEEVKTIIEAYYPSTVVLPSIGNNDGEYHNEAAELNSSTYDDLYSIWFSSLLPADTPFKTGGYYVYDVSSDLMVIALNGMYPYKKNTSYKTDGCTAMFDWLEDLLAANPSKKFII